MRKFFVRLLREKTGASLVEMALIFPVLLLLIVGALDLGASFVRKMELANAAKAGIQYAMVRKPVQGDLTNIRGAVTTSLGSTITDSTSISVELYCSCSGVKQLCTEVCADENVSAFVQIDVSENFKTPFFNYDWFIDSFPISETALIQLN